MHGFPILLLLLSVVVVTADLYSCRYARCVHCDFKLVARYCPDTCRPCHTTKEPKRPTILGEPIAETGVVQTGLGSGLHVISQQTNSAPVAQQPPFATQSVQLPVSQQPHQQFVFHQPPPQSPQPAPTQLYYPQQQPQPQFVQPPLQQQFVSPPSPQPAQPQVFQSQSQTQPVYTFPQYQPFGGPPAPGQSFLFNPFQPFLPYPPAPFNFPGQSSALLPPVSFPGFPAFGVNASQLSQPSSTGFNGQQQGAAVVGAADAQQSQIPPSPSPPANLIDSQNYQYQKPVQSVASQQPQKFQVPYPQQISSGNKKATEPEIRPQQVYSSQSQQQVLQPQIQNPAPTPKPEPFIYQQPSSVKPAELSPPVEIKTTTTLVAPQCPGQPNWQPCISKELANERFRNCCQRLGEGCVSLCSYDQNLTTIQIAVLTGRCPISKVADMMICASGYEDATPCCQAYNVFEPGFEHCKPYCNPAAGLPQGGMLSEQYKCLGKLSQIQQCFYVTQRP